MKKFSLFLFAAIMLVLSIPSRAQVQEGDTVTFWSVSYIDWPPLWGTPQRTVEAVCKKAGTHCYVFVEIVGTQPSQSAIDNLVSRFDNDFIPQLTARYGLVPDALDNDSAIYILSMDESNWGGYYDPANQMTESFVMTTWGKHSNEHEMIFIASDSFDWSAEEICAHELGHLIHWRGDHSPDPVVNPTLYWEEAWVDEGFSTFAAVYLTESFYAHNELDYSTFFCGDPDIPLIYFSDYNQAELFMIFMYEHYGNWNYITQLLNNDLNGIDGVEATLDSLGYTESFDDAFEQWCIANFIDDSVYAGGIYSYTHFRFNAAHVATNHTVFPLSTVNADVSAYGSDYVAFLSSTPKKLQVEFNGDPASKYRLAFIKIKTAGNQVMGVTPVALDASNHATFLADSLGINYNKLIMVAMNVDSTIHEGDVATYSYSASVITGLEEVAESIEFTVFPNPGSTEIRFALAENILSSTAEVYDISGKVVLTTNANAGKNRIDISSLAPGLYALRVSNGNRSGSVRFVKN
ncbi:MAG: T9SS type A sorting domain-containing protein [Bacteroidota bacterium]